METRMAIVLLCAALAANLPFILNKVAGVWAVPRKHVGWCLLELGVLYFAVGGLAYLLESQVSSVHVQKWQPEADFTALAAIASWLPRRRRTGHPARCPAPTER